MQGNNRWSVNFFYTAIMQGLLVFCATFILFAYGSVYLVPTPAEVLVSGGAGTWLLVGYAIYISMVLYLGVTSFFYYQMEQMKKKNLSRTYDILSATHLMLSNIGIIGASFLLMMAGYSGGSALLPVASGGLGLTTLQTHIEILSVYPPYVVAFIILAMLGSLCGGLSYIVAFRKT